MGRKHKYGPVPKDPKDRILDMSEEVQSGCWIWGGCVSSSGYARSFINGKGIRGSRLAWIAFIGPIPKGMCVLHKCDVPSCVNPKHLFLGTNKDNTQDASGKGRLSRGKSHHNSKLTVRTVKEIRLLYKNGMRKRHIGINYGVHEATIHDVISGRTWGWLK